MALRYGQALGADQPDLATCAINCHRRRDRHNTNSGDFVLQLRNLALQLLDRALEDIIL